MSTTEPDATLLERISARAREFDLGPLLRLLEQHYEPAHILFESNPEPVSSTALVEKVTFKPPGDSLPRRVVVTLNLGLLGSNALLPSYFLEVAEQSLTPEAFFDFIRFFDHRLLSGLVRALYPERDEALVGDWEETKRHCFHMLGVGSVSTLQWLFQLFFPELRVSVTRGAFSVPLFGHALHTGQSVLDGTAVLGGRYESDATGFQVELLAEEEKTAGGEPWAGVVHRRFELTLLPLLRPFRLPLGLALFVPSPRQAQLKQKSYLGTEYLYREDTDVPREPSGYRLELFRGDTGDAQTDAPGLPSPPPDLL
jgi:hypothetical protein